ncbi:MAG: CoA transferase [Candidatus Dormibacteraceae bacterium]
MASAGPLADLRVVELSRNVAGPFAAMLLGDLGADVVKVERPPRGDEARRHGPPFVGGESPYFLSLNRNKRSIVLDLKDPRGRALAERLLDRADVAISNYRPGVLERLGLDADSARARNPRLIFSRITGFGESGPWANRPAYDHIIQGMSGLMSVTGTQASGPLRVGVSISDLLTGLYLLYGILGALHARDRTGVGDVVDVSLLAATLASLTYQAGDHFATGSRPQPHGNDHPMIAPYGTFQTADGHLNLAVGNDPMFGALCRALGLESAAGDERYSDNPARVRHRRELHDLIGDRLRVEATAHWLAVLGTAGVACGPVLGIDEALAHPAAVALGMVQEVDHPTAGRVKMLGLPVHLGGGGVSLRLPPPRLGEHTQAVLSELGYDAGAIQSLAAGGVIG